MTSHTSSTRIHWIFPATRHVFPFSMTTTSTTRTLPSQKPSLSASSFRHSSSFSHVWGIATFTLLFGSFLHSVVTAIWLPCMSASSQLSAKRNVSLPMAIHLLPPMSQCLSQDSHHLIRTQMISSLPPIQ